MGSRIVRRLSLATWAAALLLPGIVAPAAAGPEPSVSVPRAAAVTYALPITGIAAGGDHSCAMTSDGGVLCWGRNFSGELGDGSTSSVSLPTAVIGLPGRVRSVSAGTFHSCALADDGAIWCWGRTTAPVTTVGVSPDSRVAVEVAGLGGPMTAVAAGRIHTCAVAATGGVKCWGANTRGQLGNGATTTYPRPSFVPNDVIGLTTGVTSVVAGDGYTCALTTQSGVMCWGDNTFGQLGNGTTLRSSVPVAVVHLAGPVVALAAGGLHVCAILSGGPIQCWGRNNFGQLGDGTTVDRSTPVTVVDGPGDATDITAGVLHTCARTAAGGVRCWGANQYGQLGGTSPEASSTPTPIARLATGVTAVSAGDGHTCALLIDGSVTCWGYNGLGQLGNGTTVTTFRGLPATTVDFTVHPRLLNMTAAGATTTGPFSAPTKVVRPGTTVTWRAQTIPVRTGEQVQAWMAVKTGAAWSPFSQVASRTVDADGYAWFTFESDVPQWVSVRFVLQAHGADPALASFARPVRFR